MAQMAWTFPAGNFADGYGTVTETIGNPLSDTAFQNLTCPTGKTWLVFGGSLKHDDSVGHNMTIELYDENDKLLCNLMQLDDGGGANGILNFPCGGVASSAPEKNMDGFPIPMKAGWYIKFSAAGNMTDASVIWERNAIILEVAISQ